MLSWRDIALSESPQQFSPHGEYKIESCRAVLMSSFPPGHKMLSAPTKTVSLDLEPWATGGTAQQGSRLFFLFSYATSSTLYTVQSVARWVVVLD